MYNLEKKEIFKYSKEFNKTAYGKIIFFFSLIPGCLSIVSLFLLVITALENYLDPVNANQMEENLFFISTILNCSIYAISQLYYCNILDKYVSNCSK